MLEAIIGVVALVAIMVVGLLACIFRLAHADKNGDIMPINGCSRLWAATQHGDCCTCGHEWEPGEIIGNVTQAYVIDDNGQVWHRPGTRQACVSCVEWQRTEGDLSVRWATSAPLW